MASYNFHQLVPSSTSVTYYAPPFFQNQTSFIKTSYIWHNQDWHLLFIKKCNHKKSSWYDYFLEAFYLSKIVSL